MKDINQMGLALLGCFESAIAERHPKTEALFRQFPCS
jgi:hypothetical protein